MAVLGSGARIGTAVNEIVKVQGEEVKGVGRFPGTLFT